MALDFAQVKCGKCGNEIPVDYADLDVQQVGADERNMGSEITYWGSVEVSCPRCRKIITVEYEATEYPVGVPNYDDTRVEGGELIAGFGQLDLYFDGQMYELEESSNIYVPQKKEIITSLAHGSHELVLAASKSPQILYSVDPREFEELVAYIFSRNGFQVELTKKTRDGGRDLIALRVDELGIPLKYLVECKRYAAHRPITVDIVRSLYGVQQAEGANKSVIVTTSSFTKDAIKFAKTENTTAIQMSLVDYQQLARWLSKAAH